MSTTQQQARMPSQAGKRDAFAVAAAELHGRRQIKNARLKKIAARVSLDPAESIEKELREYLAKNPDDADALSLLAQCEGHFNRRRAELALWQRCLEADPRFAGARYNYANLLFKLSRFEDALGEVDHLLAGDAANPLFLQLKANILEVIGENEQSLAIFEQLALGNPKRAGSWVSYGHALRAMGFQDKAIAAYRKAIEIRPFYGTAYWALANLKAYRFSEEDMAAMQEQLKRTDISADDRITLQSSLGKAYEDKAAYEKSFEYYAKANAGMRVRITYDPDVLSSGVAANKAIFTRELLESRSRDGCPAPDPIFILGRPRSGSTLIEQILSSHSAIEGTAELPYITSIAGQLEEREAAIPYGTLYLRALEKMAPDGLKALGEEYMRLTSVHRKQGRPFFIDKKPANFSHVGMIMLILPNAKIIDARRNPAASALSMFKHYSSKGRLRLAELGRFYRDYVELMAHFDRVAPGRIHRVIYEQMVSDPEAEVRRLLDYLGLPFEENCLRFYETKRTVLTPSSEQVRKPISGEAVDHWRNYEPWLGPLLKGLGSVFTEYPSVPEELR
ncbi:MAG TPA: sulfotransferase [Rhizomicrobium sp.]|nr:sulfotransferase [Rhizomicrobium sp.]